MSQPFENKDYESKPSVRVTGSAKREQTDPKVGLEPLSLGVFGACALAFVVGGGYIGAKSGGFDFETTSAEIVPPGEVPGGGVIQLSPLDEWLLAGKSAYATCAGCHQGNGMGNNVFPPLVDSEWPSQGTERFAQIILNGMKGSIEVNGKSYLGEMPPHKALFNDKQIAQIMTYVRHEFNGITDGVVTDEMVAHAREQHGSRSTPYTVAELAPADSMLPGEQPAWADPNAAEAAGDDEADGGTGDDAAPDTTPAA